MAHSCLSSACILLHSVNVDKRVSIKKQFAHSNEFIALRKRRFNKRRQVLFDFIAVVMRKDDRAVLELTENRIEDRLRGTLLLPIDRIDIPLHDLITILAKGLDNVVVVLAVWFAK